MLKTAGRRNDTTATGRHQTSENEFVRAKRPPRVAFELGTIIIIIIFTIRVIIIVIYRRQTRIMTYAIRIKCARVGQLSMKRYLCTQAIYPNEHYTRLVPRVVFNTIIFRRCKSDHVSRTICFEAVGLR